MPGRPDGYQELLVAVTELKVRTDSATDELQRVRDLESRVVALETQLRQLNPLPERVVSLERKVDVLHKSVSDLERLAEQNRTTWPMRVTWVLSFLGILAAALFGALNYLKK
jgi:hypothetical protein